MVKKNDNVMPMQPHSKTVKKTPHIFKNAEADILNHTSRVVIGCIRA